MTLNSTSMLCCLWKPVTYLSSTTSHYTVSGTASWIWGKFKFVWISTPCLQDYKKIILTYHQMKLSIILSNRITKISQTYTLFCQSLKIFLSMTFSCLLQDVCIETFNLLNLKKSWCCGAQKLHVLLIIDFHYRNFSKILFFHKKTEKFQFWSKYHPHLVPELDKFSNSRKSSNWRFSRNLFF